MNVSVDCVLSWHTNPATCGVAKFNALLAERLGVPLKKLKIGSTSAEAKTRPAYPLVSIKTAEVIHDVGYWGHVVPKTSPYDLFFHDVPPNGEEEIQRATRVFAGNTRIANSLRAMRHDIIEAFCPSTIQGNPHRGAINVLVFGMSHKLYVQRPYFEKLKALLEATHEDYTVSVSTAVHEGSPWDRIAETFDVAREIFGARTRILGYLADDAIAKELHECTAVAMFFDPALRANNTTALAAIDAGALLITNTDDDSPLVPVYNIDALTEFPTWRLTVPSHPYTWNRLLELVR